MLHQTAAQTFWFRFITYGITDFPQHEHVFCVREFLAALQKEVQRRMTLVFLESFAVCVRIKIKLNSFKTKTQPRVSFAYRVYLHVNGF